MSNWNELQKEARDLGVLERGMSMPEVEAAVEEAKRGRPDPRNEQQADRTAERIPLGGFRQNLNLPNTLKKALDEAGYHIRFFTEDNLTRARDAGFTPVYTDDKGNFIDTEGKWYQVAKGRNGDGTASVNYLMKQLKAHRDEDQAAKRRQLDELDQALQRGNPTGSEESNPAIYNPEGESREINKREFRR